MNITFNLNVAARFFIVIYPHDFVKNSQVDLKYRGGEDDKLRPANLSLEIGSLVWLGREFTGMIADLNVHSSSLSVEKMIGISTAGDKECGAPQLGKG